MTPSPRYVEKRFERLRFFDAFQTLVARDPVHRHGWRVLRHLEQRVERIVEHDFAVEYGDGADGDDAIGAWIQSGRLGVEHDEAHLVDGRFIRPCTVESRAVRIEKGRPAHSFFSHSRSAVNSSNCRIDLNPLFRTCRS